MNSTLLPLMASVSDFQRRYTALIKQVKKSGQPMMVLKKNKLEVVLISPDAYQEIMGKLRAYEEKIALEAIALYEKEKKSGKLKKMKKVEELFE